MKTKTGLLSLAVLLASSLSASEVEIQAVAGKNYVDNNTKSTYTDSNTLGVRNNIFFSKDNAIQLAYDRLKDVDGTKDAHRYSVNYMRIQRDNGSKVHPFMLIGGGYEDSTVKDQGFVNVGLGTTIELSNRVNLVGEIKGIKKNVDHDFDINTNIGLGIMFGNEPQNKVIKSDCMIEKIAPILVKRRTVIVDDKTNCVR